MEKVFLSILNMSLTGAFVIAVICFARLPLRKAPKFISYLLWLVAGFRLVVPFSLESIFSLMPFTAAPIPTDVAAYNIIRIDETVSSTFIDTLPAAVPQATQTPFQIWTFLAVIWLAGFIAMVIYSIVSIFLLKQKMKNAKHTEDNIYEADNIRTPFVIGLFSPKIYMPAGLTKIEHTYILLHEQTHIKRYDHIIKIAAYLTLSLHWFNPLAWLAFILMNADMEMSCDERVLFELGDGVRDDYSLSLVRFASNRRITIGCPLAFGEGGIKERVKRVLRFKKPSRVVIITAVMLAAVFSIGFALNKATDEFTIDTSDVSDVVIIPDVADQTEVLFNKRTEVAFNSGQVSVQTHLQTIDEMDSVTKWTVSSLENNIYLKANDTERDIDEILQNYAAKMNIHVSNHMPDIEGLTYYSKMVVESDDSSEFYTVYIELDSLLEDIRESANDYVVRNRNIDTMSYSLPVMVFPDSDEFPEISGSGIEHYVSSVNIVIPRGFVIGFNSDLGDADD